MYLKIERKKSKYLYEFDRYIIYKSKTNEAIGGVLFDFKKGKIYLDMYEDTSLYIHEIREIFNFMEIQQKRFEKVKDLKKKYLYKKQKKNNKRITKAKNRERALKYYYNKKKKKSN